MEVFDPVKLGRSEGRPHLAPRPYHPVVILKTSERSPPGTGLPARTTAVNAYDGFCWQFEGPFLIDDFTDPRFRRAQRHVAVNLRFNSRGRIWVPSVNRWTSCQAWHFDARSPATEAR